MHCFVLHFVQGPVGSFTRVNGFVDQSFDPFARHLFALRLHTAPQLFPVDFVARGVEPGKQRVKPGFFGSVDATFGQGGRDGGRPAAGQRRFQGVGNTCRPGDPDNPSGRFPGRKIRASDQLLDAPDAEIVGLFALPVPAPQESGRTFAVDAVSDGWPPGIFSTAFRQM